MNEYEIQYERKPQEWETRYIVEGTREQAIQYMETEVKPHSSREWRVA